MVPSEKDAKKWCCGSIWSMANQLSGNGLPTAWVLEFVVCYAGRAIV
jgi:hypothetical protein